MTPIQKEMKKAFPNLEWGMVLSCPSICFLSSNNRKISALILDEGGIGFIMSAYVLPEDYKEVFESENLKRLKSKLDMISKFI